jgi:hypothetical protein
MWANPVIFIKLNNNGRIWSPCSQPGLPDGIFTNQKSRSGKNLDGLRMEIFLGSFKIYYSHFVFFIPFGNSVVIRYILFNFGTLCQEKSGNPALDPKKSDAFQDSKPKSGKLIFFLGRNFYFFARDQFFSFILFRSITQYHSS